MDAKDLHYIPCAVLADGQKWDSHVKYVAGDGSEGFNSYLASIAGTC